MYFSLYKSEENNIVYCENATRFDMLEHNDILETFRNLYRDEVGVTLR